MLLFKLLTARNLDALIALANEHVFHGKLEKIIEVTYSYRDLGDGFLLNETLFEEYLGLELKDHSLESLGRKYRYKIGVQNALIEDILGKARKISVESRAESIRKGLFIEALEYVLNILEISLLGLDFELEKAGIPYKATETEIQKTIFEIERRERMAFGSKVIESPEELSYCFNFVLRNHEEKKHKLSKKDQSIMDKALYHIQKSADVLITDTEEIKNKTLRKNFLKNEIPRKEYRKIFDSVCDFYSLPQRTKITNAGSIYDGDTFLEIPRNKAHAVFTVERLLKLLSHEIESHYINSFNGKILVGEFRGARNLPKEEGVAMFMERIFLGYSYQDIHPIVEYFFSTMAGESLDGEGFQEFMRIMGKEYNCKRNYELSVVRAKRNYSVNYAGVQHKDTVYFRGLMQVVDYLKYGGKFWKLFLGKVSFEDLDDLELIYEASERKRDLVFPIFISDIVFYYYTELEKNPNFIFTSVEYYLYIKKKYWFLDFEMFGIVEQIETKWKKLERIIKMFEEYIVEKNS